MTMWSRFVDVATTSRILEGDIMIGIPLGLIYANATEWVVHKYVLHGFGKKKNSFWNFHWGEHHGECRKHEYVDVAYTKKLWRSWNPQSKEAGGIAIGLMLHLPLAPIAPFFYGTLVNRALHYYRVHRRGHLDPEWAKENVPWHYDHHMGKDQDANWCVTHPFMDIVMRTRKPYLGTEAERKAQRKRARRAHKEAPPKMAASA